MRGARWAALLATALLGLAACSRTPAPATSDHWATDRDAFLEATLAADPALAVGLGRHEFDGRLTDYSASALARELGRLRAARATFAAADAAGLSAERRFERDYLVQSIDAQLFWLDVARRPFTDPAFYADAMDPVEYLARDYAPLTTRLKGYLGYLHAVPGALSVARENLKPPLAASLLAHGIASFQGYAEFYAGDAHAVFDAVTDPALRSQLDAATGEAVAATAEFVAYLKAQLPRATQDFALGPERFVLMLRMTEGVTTPLAQLKAAGQADLERNLSAFRHACQAFAPGATLAACMARARDHKLPGGSIQGAREQLAGLRQFVLDNHVVSIPDEDQAEVVESPPYERDYAAALNPPGAFEHNLPSLYYISPPNPKWSRKEQRDFMPGQSTLLFTSVHEVWPGHFLQNMHANHAVSPVGRIFGSYAFAEGWAHYAEELMLEKGLWDRSPEARIGQISEALLRDVRFLSAIGLHTEGMSLAQSERLFVTAAFQGAAAARQEAARGSFNPEYLGYTLGKLMIRKLRTDWCARRGGEAAWQAFHDELLSRGAPPIPLLRRTMLGDAAGELL